MDWLRLVLLRVKYLSVHCDTLQVASLVMERLQTTSMETLETYKMKYGTTVLSLWHSIIPPPTIPPPPMRFLFLAGQNEKQAADNFLPKLTRVKVSGFPVLWSQWSLTRMTSLSINFMTLCDRPSMDMLKRVLTMNRETLEKFEIQGAIQQFGTLPLNADDLPTNLPRLTDLTLGFFSQWEANIFFLHFEAPALKHLKLCDISRTMLFQYLPQYFKDGFYLGDPIFQNMPALEPFNNFSSTILLEHLVYGWTSLLEQVETLTLENLSLPPLFSDLFLQDNDPLKQFHSARVVLAYRMLQTCSQLRRLTLTNPEKCFIHALNIYPDGADPENSGPAPVLTHLYLASSCPDPLMDFLERRAKNLAKEKGPRILDHLELATKKEHVGRVLETIVSNHIDLSCLAKSSLVADLQGSFTT
ncbi:hypothetical protein BDR05DRAFT_963805 [Suillus weaverae]|nr:hypothetical protein BDR05DRAFT_963805 [Suillus weaverae]